MGRYHSDDNYTENIAPVVASFVRLELRDPKANFQKEKQETRVV